MNKIITIERKPDYYIGEDVQVTITANTKGLKLAELLQEKFELFIAEYRKVIG